MVAGDAALGLDGVLLGRRLVRFSTTAGLAAGLGAAAQGAAFLGLGFSASDDLQKIT